MNQVPICILDLKKIATQNLDPKVNEYFRSGANYEVTLDENEKAFNRLKILPRMLDRDVTNITLDTIILGKQVKMPIGASPTAMQRLAHPDGELATVRACQKMGTIYCLSTLATSSIEEVAEAGPLAIKWFQLYIYKNRSITKNLVQRAEKAGFSALLVTVDAPYFGQRYGVEKNKFKLPDHLNLANFELGDITSDGMKGDRGMVLDNYINSLFDSSLVWKDLLWLKSMTTLPIIVKGILTPEDALLSIQYGASAIMVSNHGGRQLDSVPATIEVLPNIVKAVKGQCEVYIDGGFRSGTDIFKAIALGAKAVFVGRPIVWGLSYNGQKGVEKAFEILKREFRNAMGLSSCSHLSHITQNMITHANAFWSNL